MPSERIKNLHEKIENTLAVTYLEIIDDSHLHVDHAGATAEGESHFRIIIASSDFEGQKPIKRHQMIYRALADEMQSHIHALSIQAYTPSEYQNRTMAS